MDSGANASGPTAEEKMRKLIQYIGNPSECRLCGNVIFWVSTKRGGSLPLDGDGQPHQVTCSKYRELRLKKQQGGVSCQKG